MRMSCALWKQPNNVLMQSKTSLRIAIIIPGGIGTGPNNIGVPVLEQQVRMLSQEFQIVVFSLFPINSDYKAENFQIVSIAGKSFFIKALKLFTVFKQLNHKNRFDIIHGFWVLPSGFFAVLLGKYFSIRSVVSVLGGDAASLPAINYGQLRNLLPRSVVRWTIKNAGSVTALTYYLVNNLKGHCIERSDIHVLPWGVSNAQFPFQPVPVATPVTFLHIANFSAVKDQWTLLKAFKRIAAKIECRLTMIGEGPLVAAVSEWIQSNGLSTTITITPPVSYQHIPSFYNKAMMLLHTSLSEGQCEVVTEAMSSGLVVCGTRVGLLYDLPSCCIAVKVGDDEDLAEQVLRLIFDVQRVEILRKNAKEWAHQFNIEWTVDATASIYRKEVLQKT